MFNPVDDVDSGEYQCNMTVSPKNNNTAILLSTISKIGSLNITSKLKSVFLNNYHVYFFTPSGFPSPVVSVDSSGSAMTGKNYILECQVKFSIEPSIQPTVTWSKVEGGTSILPETSNTTTMTPKSTLLTLSFSPLTLSNRGRYRCVAELNVSGIVVFHIEKDLNLTVSCECNYSTFTISTIVSNSSFMPY